MGSNGNWQCLVYVLLESDGVPCVQRWSAAATPPVRSELWIGRVVFVPAELSQCCFHWLVQQPGQPWPPRGERILQYHQCAWTDAARALGKLSHSLFFIIARSKLQSDYAVNGQGCPKCGQNICTQVTSQYMHSDCKWYCLNGQIEALMTHKQSLHAENWRMAWPHEKRGLFFMHAFINFSLSLHFNGHFPGEPGLAGVYWSKWW